MTADGFGFGTLTGRVPEKCALSHGSGVLGPDVEKVCTVTQIRLGEGGGGGIPLGGSPNREPGSCNPPPKYKGLKSRGLEDPAPRIVPRLARTPKNGTEA